MSANMRWNVHKIDRVAGFKIGDDFPSPLTQLKHVHGSFFVKESDAIIKSAVVDSNLPPPDPQECFQKAGPRMRNTFQGKDVSAAIVTCGGICPGLNTVIRELVFCLRNQYNVQHIWGIPSGYRGFYAPTSWISLDPGKVDQIHTLGGTILGTSRGGCSNFSPRV